MTPHWLDRVTMPFAPQWTAKRQRARFAADLLARHYEAAAAGRRTQGWNRSSGDANAVTMAGLARVREQARDLIRNNPWAQSALDTIVDHTVGWGISATTVDAAARKGPAMELWERWAGTTVCDADGRHDFAGLQKMVTRAVAADGEVLIRRRWRRPEDNLPIPLQLQVLEADYIDTTKDGLSTPGSVTIQGVEFDLIGRKRGYWLFGQHPGANLVSTSSYGSSSTFVPASEILHVFRAGRPGQVRGVSWFAPVILRMRELDEYEDAALVKQKIAACLAVITTDADGTMPPLGRVDEAGVDSLEPGMIANIATGRSVAVVQPPSVSEHDEYVRTVLRGIAAGLGISYEDMTGSYDNLPFSAARMSRIRAWARVHGWRWQMVIPQFCDPVWAWAMEAAALAETPLRERPRVKWIAPPMPMIEPDKEGLAYQRNIRSGLQTLSDALRELGYEPDDVLTEMAEDWKKVDKLGLVLDSDPRKMTQAGQLHTDETEEEETPAPKPAAAQADRQPSAPALGEVYLLRADVDQALEELRELRALMSRPPQPIHVDARTTVEAGAVQNHVPPVNVEGPTVNVAPAEVTFAEGAVRVESPVTIAEGAVTVAAPPPAEVRVEAPVVNVAQPAITVEAPVVNVPPPAPAPAVRKRVTRDAEGRIEQIIETPEEG